MFFFLIFISASSLQFNLPSIGSEQDSVINVSGDASISEVGIQLTLTQSGSVGRATYSEPLHLWDKSSGLPASFSTNFVFVINPGDPGCYADGLAFFLTSTTSEIDLSTLTGGYLGLTDNTSGDYVSSTNPIVAVEFDTYSNDWDAGLSIPHIGVDVNSVNSFNSLNWGKYVSSETVINASITYDSAAMKLSVEFNDGTPFGGFDTTIDLRKKLPEQVNIGFSGATGSGSCFESNNVISWVFSSDTLPYTTNYQPPPPPNSPSPPEPPPPDSLRPPPPGPLANGSTGIKNLKIGIISCLSALIVLLALF